jgi:hypothetical protein
VSRERAGGAAGERESGAAWEREGGDAERRGKAVFSFVVEGKTIDAQFTPNKLLDRGLTVPQRLCQGALGRGDLVSRHVSPRARFHHSAISATGASAGAAFPLPLWQRGLRRRDER